MANLKEVDVFKYNLLRRQYLERAGWVLLEEKENSDLVRYGFPATEQIKIEAIRVQLRTV